MRIVEPDVVIPRPENRKWQKAGFIIGDGWSVAWRTHDAQYWGVPQRRRRICLVADFNGYTAGDVVFERVGETERPGDNETVTGFRGEPRPQILPFGESLSRDFAESGASGERPAEAAEAGASYAVRIRGGCDGGGKGALVQTEKSGTLGTGNDQTLFCMATQQGGLVRRAVDCRNGTESEVNGTLQAKESGCSLNLNNVVRESLFVRRLTPLECTRLQGFPDNWVNLGDWTDSKGKRHKEADAPKYKALGNSIALPYWRWMTRRMARYLPEHATLGSLFDGIGGFPLVWQETHGDYTARWASEIEEFPMAVTKLRFPEPETKEEE